MHWVALRGVGVHCGDLGLAGMQWDALGCIMMHCDGL